MVSHALKLLDQKGSVMVLSRGVMEDDMPYYAYVLMLPSQYLDYRKVNAQGGFDLKQFGEVVRFGKASEPPQIVIDEMRRKYGESAHFEADIRGEIERLLQLEG